MYEPMLEIVDAETRECIAIVYGPESPIQSDCCSKQPISKELRWEIWERDNFTCQECGTRKHLHIDHIVPEIRGGMTTSDNLQALCESCNLIKGSR